MAIRLADLAVRYGCELHGDPAQEVHTVGTLQAARAGAISFLANPGYRKYLADTAATAVILTADVAEDCKVACLVSDNPYAVFAAIAAELHPPQALEPGVHATASVAAGATVPQSCEIAAGAVIGRNVSLGEHVYIGPNCVIGDNSSLGADSRLVANVTLYHGVSIGARCIVHAGTVIGADGFGLAQTASGWRKVPQIGGVVVGNDVELGANCTIDRGAIDHTRIADGVKFDNQVHIAHNVTIGEHTAIAGQCGISGSTNIGARCVFGGQCAVSGHLTVADDVYLMGRSAVTRSIDKAGTYASILSVEEAHEWRKLAARFKRLNKMSTKLDMLEKKLKSADSES